jgi:methylated-DNA-[protein]-cysteine S-methyltransferase
MNPPLSIEAAMKDLALFYELQKTCLGTAAIVWREDKSGPRIVQIYLPAPAETIRMKLRKAFPAAARKTCRTVDKLRDGICAFMEGSAVPFETGAFDIGRVPPYHRRVLGAMATIPWGKVSSYGAVALKTGVPGGARAVGQGCGKNPFPIVFPCHRVVRSDGSLGGFGGGLKLKRALLEMEGVQFDSTGKVEPEFILR